MFKPVNTYCLIHVICLLTVLLPANVWPQSLSFRSISVNEGLSQNTVWGMAQDANDWIWIGTSDGLNRYDGYNMVTYYHDSTDSLSLVNNQVTSLYVDKRNTLWVGSLLGLSRYNPRTDKFTNFLLPEQPYQVLGMLDVAESDSLFLATNLGLLFFDRNEESLHSYKPLDGVVVNTLCETDGGLLIGTRAGLYHYSFATRDCELVVPELSEAPIASVIRLEDTDEYLVGCQKKYIYSLDGHWRIMGKYQIDKDFRFTPANTIRILKQHTDGTVWVATTEGLFSFHPHQGVFEESLSYLSIRSLLIDNQGALWVGTHYDGVKYHHPYAPTFNVMRSSTDSQSLNDDIVSCIVEDPCTKNLWVGTNDGGVNHYDIRTKKFTYYRTGSTRNALHSNNIKTILPDKQGNVYVGTHSGGLSYIHVKTGEVEDFSIPGMEAEDNSCYSLLDEGGHLYVGTMVGLMHFDKRSKRFMPCELAKRYPELANLLIYTLYRDSDSRLWIGTEKGLYVYEGSNDREGQLMKALPSQQNYIIAYCIYEDADRYVWVASTDGLFQFSSDMQLLEHYTMKDGLPNNCVYGILEDNAHRLWLSTNRGLSNFDKDNKQFYNYTQMDGLSHNEFNVYGYCKASNGTFYFGSLNGITYFSPFQFMENPFTPLPQVVDVSLRNVSVTYQQTEVSRVAWGEDDLPVGIRFPYGQRDLQISYAVPDYLSNHRNTFAYRLKGLDKDWTYTDKPSVSYSNLPPGHYTFQLRVCNNNGKWCEGMTEFSVEVTPEWYQTWYVRSLFALLVLGVIGWVVYFFFMKQKMKMQLQLQAVEHQKNQEVNTEKIRFYMNMSHELRTPLALILAPLENIMQREALLSESIRNDLKYIWHNCHRLLHIIDQLLSFRKAESGALPLQVEMSDVNDWSRQVFQLFCKQAEHRDINYLFQTDVTSGQLPMDKKYVETILVNLLSNAFKFTPAKGRIELSVWEKEDTFGFRVKDSGRGIPASKLGRIFERFYQVNESEKGTGIGLSLVKCLVDNHHGIITVESEEGKGTQFTISLPKRMETYVEAERSRQREESALSTYYVEDFMPAADEEASANAMAEQNADSKSFQVLLVEDNPEMSAFLQRLLQSRYDILTASNGKEALEIVKEQKVDLVLSDVMMPEMDGIQLCRQLKRNIQTSHIPVILLSAKNSVEDQTSGIHVGADDYIGKPFSPALLKGKIDNILKTRERFRQYYNQSIDIDTAKMTSNDLDKEFLAKAIQLIEENLENDKFSADDLAEALSISRSSLYVKMNAICGGPPVGFIRRIRFNKACQLLLERRYTMAEISYKLGFSSPSYFSASFKKFIGMLPTEYVKAHESEGKGLH